VGFSISGARSASLDELVAAAQAESDSNSIAMCEIVRRFEPATRRLARSLTPDTWVQDDIANAARYAVVMAVRAHDRSMPGFPSYVMRTMRGEASRAFGRAIREAEANTDRDAVVWDLERHRVYQPTVQAETDLALLTKDLSDEQRHLVFGRYVQDKQLADIAETAGGTVSAVSYRLKTIHRVVRAGIEQRRAVAA
jgi:RNA polymerase sigma factor (sigma-70 family)